MEKYLNKIISSNGSESNFDKIFKKSTKNSTLKNSERLNRSSRILNNNLINEDNFDQDSLLNETFKRPDDDKISSQINELSSIESLLAAMHFDEQDSKSSSNFFTKLLATIKVYFLVLKLILFESQDKNVKDNLKNASFIYNSNFLIGLGITTVIIFNFKNFKRIFSKFFPEFFLHRQEGCFGVAKSDRRETMGI